MLTGKVFPTRTRTRINTGQMTQKPMRRRVAENKASVELFVREGIGQLSRKMRGICAKFNSKELKNVPSSAQGVHCFVPGS